MGDQNKQRIAIVYIEDDPEMVELVKMILLRRGFIIRGAFSGQQGLDIIDEETPDLILLDLMMPGMDGWDVYQKLRSQEQTKNIPVIIITAKAQKIDRVLGLAVAKVDAYISKPFAPQELISAIESVITPAQ